MRRRRLQRYDLRATSERPQDHESTDSIGAAVMVGSSISAVAPPTRPADLFGPLANRARCVCLLVCYMLVIPYRRYAGKALTAEAQWAQCRAH